MRAESQPYQDMIKGLVFKPPRICFSSNSPRKKQKLLVTLMVWCKNFVDPEGRILLDENLLLKQLLREWVKVDSPKIPCTSS